MRTRRLKRLGKVIAPFLLLISCLAIINVTFRLLPDSTLEALPPTEAPPVTVTPVANLPTRTDRPIPTETITLSPEPTPSATGTSTPDPTPTLPPDSAIHLLGPPDGSSLGRSDSITFYWIWPHPLSEDDYFVVILTANEQAHILEPVSQPNLGSTYHFRADLGQLVGNSGTLQWQVNLQSTSTQLPLLESETRTIRLLP